MTLQEFIAGSPDTYSGIIFGVMAIIGFYCGFALRRQYLNHIARFATRHPDLPEDEAQHLGARSFRIKTAKELFKLTYLIPIITYVNEWRIPSTPGDFIFLSIAAIAGILLYGMKKSHVMQSR
ncbi:hypothetical protein [uncultured Muribaculum sp.]|nr:hypothetical protein [uncultured Muribaculum sp.]